jgi:membrane protein
MISIGAIVAILTWIVASALFGFYVANFASYNKTYGSLAGVIVFLLWLWITNLALLFGAELDAELERGRQLQAGMPAEETIQLPARDTRKSDKAAEKERADVDRGRRLRQSRGRSADTDEGSDDGAARTEAEEADEHGSRTRT